MTTFLKLNPIFKFYIQKLCWMQNFSQISKISTILPFLPLVLFRGQNDKISKMVFILKFYAQKQFWVQNLSQIGQMFQVEIPSIFMGLAVMVREIWVGRD